MLHPHYDGDGRDALKRPPLPASAVACWSAEFRCIPTTWYDHKSSLLLGGNSAPVIAAEPGYFAGRVAVETADSAGQYFSSFSLALYALGDRPWIMSVGRLRSTSANTRTLQSAGVWASNKHYALEMRSSAFAFTLSNATTILAGPALDTNQHVFKYWTDGTNANFKVDSTLATTAYALAAPAANNAVSLGDSVQGAGAGGPMSTELYLLCTSKPTAAEELALDGWVRSRFFR